MSAPFVEVEVDRVVLMPGEDVQVVFVNPEERDGPFPSQYQVHLAIGQDGRPKVYVSDGIDVLDWSERVVRVCGCGEVLQDGLGPKTHGICPRCEEAYDLELANESGPVSRDGGEAVDPTTPGHEGGDALRPEGNEAEVST